MDSLLANYASSDEEEEDQRQEQSKKIDPHPPPPQPSTPKSSSLFSFLPPPKTHLPNPPQTLPNPSSSKPKLQEEDKGSEFPSNFESPAKPSSFLSSLPKPKSQTSSSSSSIFSSLPPPKSHKPDPNALTHVSSTPASNPKRVVQLKLPINPSLMKSRDSDDDDDDKEREGKKFTESSIQTSSVMSFLSSIPAPKNSSTLGALPSNAGSGRRSIIESDVHSLKNSTTLKTETEVGVNSTVVDGAISASFGDVSGSAEYPVGGGGDSSGWVTSGANSENYESYSGYGNYGYYGQYDSSNWSDGSTAMMPQETDTSGTSESLVKLLGKRGRNEIPQEIIEVKQDELIKNRPREDQVRLTGIAFGPSYQPVSTKGKPTKLHKRKHQIGSLYFDMKQKEMELADRRAKGFLTKAETQAKYGW